MPTRPWEVQFVKDSGWDIEGGDNTGGRGQRYEFSDNGHLVAIKEARNKNTGTTYWRPMEVNARGKVTYGLYGNGMVMRDFYDPQTGELTARVEESDNPYLDEGETTIGDGYSVAQFVSLDWDPRGRLSHRTDLSLPVGSRHEWFTYDSRNRLERVYQSTSDLLVDAIPLEDWGLVLEMEYDLSGNIVAKSDVNGPYLYQNTPHAVTQAGIREFEYDAAGNLENDRISSTGLDERKYTYTPFQKLQKITRVDDPDASGSNGTSAEFFYGPDRARAIHLKRQNGSIVESTFYVGNVEVHTTEQGDTEWRRYIAGKVLVTVDKVTDSSRERYLHRNHLGSIVAVSDETSVVVARMSFDAWGKRRNPDFTQSNPTWSQWLADAPPDWLTAFGDPNAFTPRGFTGHEHLDDLGVIHANGRIYDPQLARFLQADPFVEDSATLNRYTYSHNSPLVYYDPSGYFSFKDFARTVISVAISVYTGGAAASGQWALFGAGAETLNAVTTVMIGGALSGAVSSGSWDGALWGAFSGAAFYGVGQWVSSPGLGSGDFAGSGLSGAQFAAKTIGHGLAGGIITDLRGGKFGHGFASSFVSAGSHPYIANGMRGRPISQGALSAMVGGTASRLSGGKFANGAATAAIAYAFNQLQRNSPYEGRAESEEAAIDRGLDSARAERRKTGDVSRNDWPGFEYGRYRGARLGGVVRDWDDYFTYPRAIDFTDGTHGFNVPYGRGLVPGAWGPMDVSNVRALIINTPRANQPPLAAEAYGTSASFGGIPIYYSGGTSNNVIMFRSNSSGSETQCVEVSGSWSC